MQHCSEKSFVIPEAELDYDRLQKLSYHHNLFPTAREAYDTVKNHTEANLYDLPSSKAYSSAIELALKKDKSEQLDGHVDVQEDTEVSLTSESEIDISREAKMKIGSDTDDLESE